MKNIFKYLGPGIVVAATGVGAGDMIAATVGGSSYGFTILWAVVLGAIFKYVLNEGIGRWQLKSVISVPEAWILRMPSVFPWYFIIYLVLWTFIVSAALIAATGLAANSIFPVLTVNEWGIIHTVIAALFVFFGNYKYFELVMKILISLLFVIVILSIIILFPNMDGFFTGLFIPSFMPGSGPYIMAIIGGVGGSVTLLSYGYWISEKEWKGIEKLNRIRIDLAVAYSLTAIFGICIVIISANLKPDVVKSNQIILALANEIEKSTGETGRLIFLIGFWGAVFTSMLGVWQGVPYLFADFITTWRNEKKYLKSLKNNKYYKWYLLFIAFPPLIILFYQKPVWLIMAYSITGALFMPFLAVTLLWITNKKDWIQDSKSGLITNIIFILTILLFGYLAVNEIINNV